MKKKNVLALAAVIMLGMTGTVLADTFQYSYVGNSLTPTYTIGSVQNQFSGANSLLFEFTTSSALAANSTYSSLDILGWSASDGIYSYGNTVGVLNSFDIKTDALGKINHWDVVGGASSFPSYPSSVMFSIQSDFNMLTLGYSGHFWDLVAHTNADGQYSAVAPNLGSWQLGLVQSVPEPETYAMILAGLGLIAGFARSKRHTA